MSDGRVLDIYGRCDAHGIGIGMGRKEGWLTAGKFTDGRPTLNEISEIATHGEGRGSKNQALAFSLLNSLC